MYSRHGLYAYGLVGKGPGQFDILGIDQQSKVYPVEGKDICVLVSEIDIDRFQNEVKHLFSQLIKSSGIVQSGAEEILQAHENVVNTIMKDTTIVPFKFGTILKDENAASKMLHDDEEKFKKLLAKFTGRSEWGLKVYADKQEFTRHVSQIKSDFKILQEDRAKLSKGAAYLLGRKMEEEIKNYVVTQLAKIAEIILRELEKDADEAKLDQTLPQKLTGKKQEMILNTAYLVTREKIDHFCKRAQRLSEKYKPMGLDLEVTGPWPPYSFT